LIKEENTVIIPSQSTANEGKKMELQDLKKALKNALKKHGWKASRYADSAKIIDNSMAVFLVVDRYMFSPAAIGNALVFGSEKTKRTEVTEIALMRRPILGRETEEFVDLFTMQITGRTDIDVIAKEIDDRVSQWVSQNGNVINLMRGNLTGVSA